MAFNVLVMPNTEINVETITHVLELTRLVPNPEKSHDKLTPSLWKSKPEMDMISFEGTKIPRKDLPDLIPSVDPKDLYLEIYFVNGLKLQLLWTMKQWTEMKAAIQKEIAEQQAAAQKKAGLWLPK